MDNKFQTSFIPKKPMSMQSVSSTGNSINIFLLISIFVLVVSCLGAGWVFLMQNNLNNSIKTSDEKLVSQQKTNDPDTINNLIKLDNRLQVSTEILNKHIAISPIFTFLQEHTVSNVRFKTFAYAYGTDGISLKLSGVAKDFQTISAQSDEFKRSQVKAIVNPIFSDFAPTVDGTVTFSLSASVDPQFINYSIQKNGTDQNVDTSSAPVSQPSSNPTSF